MTTKVIGGTVTDLAGVGKSAQITITLLTKTVFRSIDSASLVQVYTVFTNSSGLWTATVECNDTITPDGTLYEVKEDYDLGGWKTYLIQVLSTLPVGTNQVLGLIVPEMSPVGIVNDYLTKAEADLLYDPLGTEVPPVTITEYTEDDVAPANPTGPTVIAVRADTLSAQGSNGDWVAFRVTSKGELYCKVVDAINVLGPVTNAELRASPIPVTGSLSVGAPAKTEIICVGAGAGVLTNMPIDVTNYWGVSFQLSGTWAGSISSQGSNDGVTWFNVLVEDMAVGSFVGTATANTLKMTATPFKYWRLNFSPYTSGTVTAIVELLANAHTVRTVSMAGSPTAATDADGMPVLTTLRWMNNAMVFNGTTWDRARSDGTVGGHGVGGTAAAAATDSGNPVKIGGRYDATLPLYTDGQRGNIEIGSRGSVHMTPYGPNTTVPLFGGPAVDNADGLAVANVTRVQVEPLSFNGTTFDRFRSDGTTGGQAIGGTVAAAATDSGNPVKVGGKYNATLPTYTDGQRGDIQIGAKGTVLTELRSGTGAAQFATPVAEADSRPAVTTTPIRADLFTFNGATWDQFRNDGTIGGSGVGGTVANAATDAGNPVKIGGKVNTTRPTYTDGQRADAQIDIKGNLGVALYDGATANKVSIASLTADGVTSANVALVVRADNEIYNGATWDRWRGDVANGADVDVTRLPALPAGTNNIGDVDVLTMPAITGTVAVSSLPTTPAGTNNIGDVDVLTLPTTPAGTNVIGKVAAEQVASAAPTQVAVSTTNATLKASNAARKGFMIFNDTTVPLLVKFGATASATSFNVKIPAAAVYEQPIPGGWVYTGIIDGILGSGSGNAYVTEV